MIIGAIVLAVLGKTISWRTIRFNIFLCSAFTHEDIGGYESLIDKYFNATANIRAPITPNGTDLCGKPPDDAMKLLRSQSSDLPWSGMTFGLAISSIWYWCSDQVIVQRALASKDMR